MSFIGHPGGTFNNYAPFPPSFSYPSPAPIPVSYAQVHEEHFQEASLFPYHAHPAHLPPMHLPPSHPHYGYPVPMGGGIAPQTWVQHNPQNFVEAMPRYVAYPPPPPHFGAPTPMIHYRYPVPMGGEIAPQNWVQQNPQNFVEARPPYVAHPSSPPHFGAPNPVAYHPGTHVLPDVGFPREQTSDYSGDVSPHIPQSEDYASSEGEFPPFRGNPFPSASEDNDLNSRPASPIASQTDLVSIPGYQIVTKTVLCFYHSNLGKCKYGTDCTFAHSSDDLGKRVYRPMKGFKEESSSSSSIQQLTSKVSQLSIQNPASQLSPTAAAFEPEPTPILSSIPPFQRNLASWSLSSSSVQAPLSERESTPIVSPRPRSQANLASWSLSSSSVQVPLSEPESTPILPTPPSPRIPAVSENLSSSSVQEPLLAPVSSPKTSDDLRREDFERYKREVDEKAALHRSSALNNPPMSILPPPPVFKSRTTPPGLPLPLSHTAPKIFSNTEIRGIWDELSKKINNPSSSLTNPLVSSSALPLRVSVDDSSDSKRSGSAASVSLPSSFGLKSGSPGSAFTNPSALLAGQVTILKRPSNPSSSSSASGSSSSLSSSSSSPSSMSKGESKRSKPVVNSAATSKPAERVVNAKKVPKGKSEQPQVHKATYRSAAILISDDDDE